jgi:predicted nucleic acid-binding Zn ribbon protein
MKMYNYAYIECKDYMKIVITKLDDDSFYKEGYCDNDVKPQVKATGVRYANTGYLYLARKINWTRSETIYARRVGFK